LGRGFREMQVQMVVLTADSPPGDYLAPRIWLGRQTAVLLLVHPAGADAARRLHNYFVCSPGRGVLLELGAHRQPGRRLAERPHPPECAPVHMSLLEAGTLWLVGLGRVFQAKISPLVSACLTLAACIIACSWVVVATGGALGGYSVSETPRGRVITATRIARATPRSRSNKA
jgi:hypothetical protein